MAAALPELAPFLDNGGSTANMMAMMELAIESGELLEEPEFEQVFIEPIEAVSTLIKVAEEMGLGPEILREEVTEEEDEARDALVSKVCQQLLTPALRRQLLEGLRDLRKRLGQSAEQTLRQQAAATQFILETDETGDLVPVLGLVRSLVLRSVDAGFALTGAAMEMEEAADQEGPLSLEALQEHLTHSKWGANLEKAVEQSPGLRQYLENQIDEMYEEGVKATFSGELALNLYTPDEVAVAVQMAEKAFAAQEESQAAEGAFKTIMGDLIPQYTGYIEQLFTPERLTQLRQDLAAAAADPTRVEAKWAAFLRIKQKDFAEDDAIDNEQRFLVAALLGQVLPLLRDEEGGEDSQDDLEGNGEEQTP